MEWTRVKAEVGGPLDIINPWTGDVEIARRDTTTIMGGDFLELETVAGEVVSFREQRR